MSDIICITNRKICKEDFLTRIEKIASANPFAIILREKDLDESEYKELAEKVLKIGKKYNTEIILHNYAQIAVELNCKAIHMPLSELKKLDKDVLKNFSVIGASCHSIDDVENAVKLGCTYVTAGHIFATDCKKGVPPRGTEFLKSICDFSPVPVYAIGGIDSDNYNQIKSCGAAGACVMSSAMLCDNVSDFLSEFKEVTK